MNALDLKLMLIGKLPTAGLINQSVVNDADGTANVFTYAPSSTLVLCLTIREITRFNGEHVVYYNMGYVRFVVRKAALDYGDPEVYPCSYGTAEAGNISNENEIEQHAFLIRRAIESK